MPKRSLEPNDGSAREFDSNTLIEPHPPKRKKDNKYFEKSLPAYYAAITRYNRNVIQIDEKKKLYELEEREVELEGRKLDLEERKVELLKSKNELNRHEDLVNLSCKLKEAEVKIMEATAEDIQKGIKAINSLDLMHQYQVKAFVNKKENDEVAAIQANDNNFKEGTIRYHS